MIVSSSLKLIATMAIPRKSTTTMNNFFIGGIIHKYSAAGFYGVLSGRFTSHLYHLLPCFRRRDKWQGFLTSYPHAKLTEAEGGKSDIDANRILINNFHCRILWDVCPSTARGRV